MKKWLNFALMGIILAAVVAVIINNFPEEEKVEDEQYVFNVNQASATNFELPLIDGSTMELADTRGKITIVNFWASWCEPCKLEAPHLQNFYEANKDEVELLAVNVTKKDSREDAQQFVDDYGLTFPVLLDETGDVSTMYGAFTIPTTIFLNADGTIVQEIAGPMDEEILEGFVAESK